MHPYLSINVFENCAIVHFGPRQTAYGMECGWARAYLDQPLDTPLQAVTAR